MRRWPVAVLLLAGFLLPTARAHQNTLTVDAVTPGVVPAGRPAAITISGSGFTGASSVRIGGVEAEFTALSDVAIAATAPPRGAGRVEVEVRRTDDPPAAAFATNGLTYAAVPGGELQQLTRAEFESHDCFGCSLATGGGRLVVGDPAGRGRVDVFAWDGTAWVSEAVLAAPAPVGPVQSGGDDPAETDAFGTAVAADGARAVVSAPGAAGCKAFVFERTSAWRHLATLEAPACTDTLDFGADVAIAGDRVAIGSAGTVFVYADSGSGWALETTLAPAASGFGSRVALSASTLVTTDGHKVYTFENAGSGWTQTDVIDVVGDAEPGRVADLALDGTVLAVGVPGQDDGFGPRGKGRLFRRVGDATWEPWAEFVSQDPQMAAFGRSVAVRGGQVLIAGQSVLGPAAYLFDLTPGGWHEVGPFVGALQPSDGDAVAVALAPDAGVTASVVVGIEGCWGWQAPSARGCVNAFAPAPAIVAVTPSAGSTSGGDAVWITGRGFPPSGLVSFGGVPAQDVAFINGQTLVARTPAHAQGAAAVTVSSSSGYAAVQPGAFTYVVPPAPMHVAGVTPNSGTAGQPVTITGSGFVGACVVSFEDVVVSADHVVVVDDGTLRVVAPPHAWGPVDVTVTNAAGGRATLWDGFTYDAPVSAPDGILARDAGVFGSRLDVASDVAVIGSDVASGHAAQAFVYRRQGGRWRVDATIVDEPDLPPGGGVATDGDGVAAAGRDAYRVFESAMNRWWVPVMGVRTLPPPHLPLAMDAGTLVVGVPAKATVRVYTRGDPAWAQTQSLEPPSGVSDPAFGQAVAIDGSWLAVGGDAHVVLFERSGGRWQSRTVLTSPQPPGVPFGHVLAVHGTVLAVGTPAAATAGLPNAGAVFLYQQSGTAWIGAGSLTSPDPEAGGRFGAAVDLNDGWLAVQAPGAVGVDGRAGEVHVYEDLGGWTWNWRARPWADGEAYTRAMAVGDHELFVGSTSGVVIEPLPPSLVTAVQPALGPASGGTLVTITGARFTAGSSVRVGGTEATQVTVVDPQTITARTPAHAGGPVDVQVRRPDGATGTLRGGFTYEDVDLVVSALVAPAALGPGETRSMTVNTKNLGPGTTPPSTTALYLSADALVDAGDALLNTHSVPALAAGRRAVTPVVVTVPAGTTAGPRFLIAVADAQAVVGERHETNNVRAKPVQAACDLLVSAIAAPLGSLSGRTVTVAVNTRNTGPGRAPASTTRLYLSADTVIDPDDAVLVTHAVGSLAPDGIGKGSVAWTIPAGTVPGRYYLLGRADAAGEVPESSETNNVRSKAFTVR